MSKPEEDEDVQTTVMSRSTLARIEDLKPCMPQKLPDSLTSHVEDDDRSTTIPTLKKTAMTTSKYNSQTEPTLMTAKSPPSTHGKNVDAKEFEAYRSGTSKLLADVAGKFQAAKQEANLMWLAIGFEFAAVLYLFLR